MTTQLQLALVSCALLGLRHGFDYDHLAAISDITSVQRGWREGMRLGLLYALGHALTVALLGCAVICFHLTLPAGMDAVGERLQQNLRPEGLSSHLQHLMDELRKRDSEDRPQN